MTDKREPITQEWVREKLLWKHNMELRIHLLIVIPYIVLLSVITALLAGQPGFWVFIGMDIFLLLIGILRVTTILKKRSMARTMQFSLVPDTVIDLVEEDRYVRHGRRNQWESALYFARYGRFAVDSERFRLTEYGDEMLLVIYENGKDWIEEAYSLKTYRLEENEPNKHYRTEV